MKSNGRITIIPTKHHLKLPNFYLIFLGHFLHIFSINSLHVQWRNTHQKHKHSPLYIYSLVVLLFIKSSRSYSFFFSIVISFVTSQVYHHQVIVDQFSASSARGFSQFWVSTLKSGVSLTLLYLSLSG